MKKIEIGSFRKRINWQLLSCLLILTSCQTTSFQEIELPVVYLSNFENCHTGDGTISLSSKFETKFPRIEFDWAVQKYPSIALESYNPMGQTVAAIRYDAKSNKIKVRGALKDLSGRLSVKDNDIFYEGNFIGLRTTELACYLKAKLPHKWLNHVSDYKKKKASSRYFVSSFENRTIYTKMKKTKSGFYSCSRFEMTKYLGAVKYGFEMCMSRRNNENSVSIKEKV